MRGRTHRALDRDIVTKETGPYPWATLNTQLCSLLVTGSCLPCCDTHDKLSDHRVLKHRAGHLTSHTRVFSVPILDFQLQQ